MLANDKLRQKNSAQKFICVGLDPDIKKIPKNLKSKSNPILEFNKLIIENTADLAAAYKFNLAFYERDGSSGINTLIESIKLIPSEILIIGDGKRGDIGNTSEKYAEMLYDEFKFDSATLNPYMGLDSIKPFLNYDSKLNFILALTSNPSASDFEKLLLVNNSYLYQEVIRKVHIWNEKKNCGLVFGATNKAELENDIGLFGDMPILLPGVGEQGGSLGDIVSLFKQKGLKNYLINVSRGIIYKSSSDDFWEAARNELKFMNETVHSIYKS
ncbi:MAG: orotidine-5'-phosphate decarboxylase [Ignavibacteriaceae bacterium]|nr:orotidine-5'-phosphate decarboxylase [Ignavibacteriaceae bacterium]